MKVKIVESLCIACGLCREVCPERAVHPKMQDIHHMYEVIANECTGCADCLPYCPGLVLWHNISALRSKPRIASAGELRSTPPRRENCIRTGEGDESAGASLYICHTRVQLRALGR